MNQTVLATSVRQALHINDNTTVLSVNVDTPAFVPGFETILIENSYFKPLSIFKYGDRIKVSFGLRQPYAAHYVLTRGLIEFHRSKDYVFDYNRSDRTFHVSVSVNEVDKLHQFLNNIAVWLGEEIYFKSALKQIIAFEENYKLKMAEVYRLQEIPKRIL